MDHAQCLAGEVEHRIADARSILYAGIRKQELRERDGLDETIMEAARNSEYLTERLRRMTLELTADPVKYKDFAKELAGIQGIGISYTDFILTIILPVLVPHRKAQYTDYLYKPLYTALQNWCRKRREQHIEIPRYENATICFIHCYDEKLPLSRVRDNDNIEEKHILDVVGSFFLKSDSGIYVNTYHETKLAEMDRTYLYVMPAGQFPKWILRAGSVKEGIEKKSVSDAPVSIR